MKPIMIMESVTAVTGSNFFYTGLVLGNEVGFKDHICVRTRPGIRDLRVKLSRHRKPTLVPGDHMNPDGMWVARFDTQDVGVCRTWPGNGRVFAATSSAKNLRVLASGRHADKLNSNLADDLVAMIEPGTMVVVKKVSQKIDYYWFGDDQAVQFHPQHRPDILEKARVNLTTSGRIRFQDLVPAYTLIR